MGCPYITYRVGYANPQASWWQGGGFCWDKRETVKALLVWMEEFGVEFDVLWYAECVDQNGLELGKVVTFGMFAWAMPCGVISEEDLWEAEGSLGSMLAFAVSLCHGTGLVDADVLSFVRCGVIVLDVSFIVVLFVSGGLCCSLVLTVPRFGSCVGG